MSEDPEAYDGPATLVTPGRSVDVEVRLRGQFQPVDGRYHWWGRVVRDADVDALVGTGGAVVLRTPAGEGRARLSDRDPWGRYRVAGTGAPPWLVRPPTGHT